MSTLAVGMAGYRPRRWQRDGRALRRPSIFLNVWRWGQTLGKLESIPMVNYSIEGDVLVIRVDVGKAALEQARPSASGKTKLVGSRDAWLATMVEIRNR